MFADNHFKLFKNIKIFIIMRPTIIVLILTISFFWLPSTSISAQTSTNNFEALATVNENLIDLEADDWTFFAGEDANTFFIDFEKIKSNLNEIKVRDSKGTEVFQDELWNLPVDTIYELDFQTFEKGTYTIEITTFTESIERKVEVE